MTTDGEEGRAGGEAPGEDVSHTTGTVGIGWWPLERAVSAILLGITLLCLVEVAAWCVGFLGSLTQPDRVTTAYITIAEATPGATVSIVFLLVAVVLLWYVSDRIAPTSAVTTREGRVAHEGDETTAADPATGVAHDDATEDDGVSTQGQVEAYLHIHRIRALSTWAGVLAIFAAFSVIVDLVATLVETATTHTSVQFERSIETTALAVLFLVIVGVTVALVHHLRRRCDGFWGNDEPREIPSDEQYPGFWEYPLPRLDRSKWHVFNKDDDWN